MMPEPGDMQTVWYTLMLGGRGEEISVSLPIRLDADDEKLDAGSCRFAGDLALSSGDMLW
jgi:azurin